LSDYDYDKYEYCDEVDDENDDGDGRTLLLSSL